MGKHDKNFKQLRDQRDAGLAAFCELEKSEGKQRNKAIAGVVAIYALASGGMDVPDTNEWTGVQDILSDLRVHCRANKIPFQELLDKVIEIEDDWKEFRAAEKRKKRK